VTVLEKIMRAQFEAWRSRMDMAGEHQDRLHAFEELNESEHAFGLAAARAMVEALKDLPDHILAVIRYDMYEPNYREQTNDVFDAILNEKAE
jgi:hypothetical protein